MFRSFVGALLVPRRTALPVREHEVGAEASKTSVLTQRLRMAGAERGVHRISAAEGDTKTARFWGVPIEVLDDDE